MTKMEKNTESNFHEETKSLIDTEDYTPNPTEHLVTEKDKLCFAKQILLAIFILAIISIIVGCFGFTFQLDMIKTALFPVTTLILGYYFAASK